MLRTVRFSTSCLAFLLALPSYAGIAHAQYMYLDANGDGISTAADHLQALGTPTVVDAWVDTNHNKGGAPALCNTEDGDLGIWNRYVVNLEVTHGTVTFTNFVNHVEEFTDFGCDGTAGEFNADSTGFTACRGTQSPVSAGLRRMFSITITGRTRFPSIYFVPLGHFGQEFTSFGTPCSGGDFDNTYKLGSDFFDNDGLYVIIDDFGTPFINAPATVRGITGVAMSIKASASDPDPGDQVTLSQTNGSRFLPSSSSAGPSLNPSITLRGVPGPTDVGQYLIRWFAIDNSIGTATMLTNLFIDRAASPNLVENSSFESSAAGWKPRDGATLTRVPGGFVDDWALEVRGRPKGTDAFSIEDHPGWVTRAGSAGSIYRFTACIRSDATVGDVNLVIREDGAKVHRSETTSATIRPNSEWRVLSIDRTLLETGSTLEFQVTDTPIGPGEAFQIDAVSVVLVSGGSVQDAAATAARAPASAFYHAGAFNFATGRSGSVRVRVFDVSGRLVRTLLDRTELPAARHSVRFDGKDDAGRNLASGIYFYRIEEGGAVSSGRIAIAR